MFKDTEFFNTASSSYSSNRYPVVSQSYTQHFFKKRLSVVIDLLRDSPEFTGTGFSVLEIGCADGVVLRNIYESFGQVFSEYTGIDTSPKMIEVAEREHGDVPILFKVRERYAGTKQHDLIIEIGVLNYVPSIRDECMYVHRALKDTGIYVCSLAGTNSIWNKIKSGDKGYSSFLSYEEYQSLLQRYFTIEKEIPVGFFVPLLWRVPSLARIIQPIIEWVFEPILPNLFHEKVYILKRK